jgi:hypothetical protein
MRDSLQGRGKSYTRYNETVILAIQVRAKGSPQLIPVDGIIGAGAQAQAKQVTSKDERANTGLVIRQLIGLRPIEHRRVELDYIRVRRGVFIICAVEAKEELR